MATTAPSHGVPPQQAAPAPPSSLPQRPAAQQRRHQTEVLPDETREMMQAQRYHAFVRFHRNIELIGGVLRPARGGGAAGSVCDGADDELGLPSAASAVAAADGASITACADEAALVRMRQAIEAETAHLRLRHAEEIPCTFGLDGAGDD